MLLYLACGAEVPLSEVLFIRWSLNPLDRSPSFMVDIDPLANILKWVTIVVVFPLLSQTSVDKKVLFMKWSLNPVDHRPSSVEDMDPLVNTL